MSYARKVYLPPVPVSMIDMDTSKRRINKLITKYKNEVKRAEDPLLKHSKQIRIEVLEEILKTYKVIEETN